MQSLLASGLNVVGLKRLVEFSQVLCSLPRRSHLFTKSLQGSHQGVVWKDAAAVGRNSERLLTLRTSLLTAWNGLATHWFQTRATERMRARQTFGIRELLMAFQTFRHGVLVQVAHTYTAWQVCISTRILTRTHLLLRWPRNVAHKLNSRCLVMETCL